MCAYQGVKNVSFSEKFCVGTKWVVLLFKSISEAATHSFQTGVRKFRKFFICSPEISNTNTCPGDQENKSHKSMRDSNSSLVKAYCTQNLRNTMYHFQVNLYSWSLLLVSKFEFDGRMQAISCVLSTA